MSDKFKYAWNHANTRQCNNKVLEVPSGKHTFSFENSFRYSAVTIWNNLNINIIRVVVYATSKPTM